MLLINRRSNRGSKFNIVTQKSAMTKARASAPIYPEQTLALCDTLNGCMINTLRQKHHCHRVLSWHCHFIVMAVRSVVLMSCSTVYVTDVAVIRAAACEGLSLQPRHIITPVKVIVEMLDDGDGSDKMRHGSTKITHFSQSHPDTVRDFLNSLDAHNKTAKIKMQNQVNARLH